MSVAYIECFDGFKSEMLLGALFDLGLRHEEWLKHMAKIGVHENNFVIERVHVNEMAATAAKVIALHLPGDLFFSDMEKLIDSWELPQLVKEKSKLVFQHWGNAEAKVRNTEPSLICFSDVVSVGNIVGNILAWHLLGEPDCYVSPIQLGCGQNKSDNNGMPFPAPATIELLLGYPTVSTGLPGEGISSAAAALLRTLAIPAPQQAFIGEKAAYGAAPETHPTPSIVRIQLGKWYVSSQSEDSSSTKKGTIVIETNIDDMNPEWAGHLVQRLLSLGARDAYFIPIIMKKGRPGLLLRVACPPNKQMDIQKEIVRQTTTIGMRFYTAGSWSVPNKIVHVQTSIGEFPVKIAFLDDEIVNVAPEYEACRQAAETLGTSVKKVYQTVLGEALKQYPLTT